MAKQGFPGLVLVPPSDRQIARRRLAFWTFMLVTVICGISTLNAWLAPTDTTIDCQPRLDLDTSPDSHVACNPAETEQSLAAFPDRESVQEEVIVAAAPLDTASMEPQPAKPVPPLPVNRPQTQPETTHTPPAVSTTQATNSPVHPVAPPREERHTATHTATKPVSHPAPDAHLAEHGDAFAQYRLGKFYAKQSGPEAPESVSWYKKASAGLRRLAETGNGEAMYVLGVMYAFGRGVQQDTEEARRWLTRAVEHQVAAARPVLASLDKHRLAERDRTDNGG